MQLPALLRIVPQDCAKICGYLDRSLMLVTALSPVIARASSISHYAMNNDLTLKAAALTRSFVTERSI